jgi:hypothetical protein
VEYLESPSLLWMLFPGFVDGISVVSDSVPDCSGDDDGSPLVVESQGLLGGMVRL